MKKAKLIASLFIIIIMASSVLYGCDLSGTPSANAIYNKYMQIVSEHTVFSAGSIGQDPQIIAEQSLFNANFNVAITYKESDLKYEILQRINAIEDTEKAIFSVFDKQYPITLYSSLTFFNTYRQNLLNTTNIWSDSNLKAIYSNLLAFEKETKNFKKTKQALENISITYNEANLTSPYSYSIMIKYDDFKKTYERLIYSAISLSKSFEKAFFETVSNANQYLQVSQVPYFEVKRSVYSASIYLAEAVYHYYINHYEGFLDANANTNLYDDMVALRTAIQTIQQVPISDAQLTNINDTSYYRTLRAHEQQVSAQSRLYVNAIAMEKQLKNSTKPSDISLYNDYVTIVNEVTQNYRNYASFATEMMTRIGIVE